MHLKKPLAIGLGAATVLFGLILVSLLAALRADQQGGDVLAGLGITGSVFAMLSGGVAVAGGLLGVSPVLQVVVGALASFSLWFVGAAGGILYSQIDSALAVTSDLWNAAAAFATIDALLLAAVICALVSPLPAAVHKEDE